jgi:hypothetical protein
MPLVDGQFLPLSMPPKHARVLTDQSKPWRFRCLHGGRSGGKDWQISAYAIERAVRMPTRFVCFREIQKSIKDSILLLLSDTIKRLGYSDYFVITRDEIVCNNGSSFIFIGLRDLTAATIKSMEGIDVAVGIEAQYLTKKSFDVFEPTIRKAGSEIWLDWNDFYEDDFVNQRFVVNPPEDAIIDHVNFEDVPAEWISDVTRNMIARAKAENDPEYEHIWHGALVNVGKKIWPTFTNKNDPAGHLRTFDWDLIRDKANCVMVMDPHSHYYPFCLWIAVIPKNDRHNWPEDYYKFVYNEWPTFETFNAYYHDVRHTTQYTGSLSDIAKEIFHYDGTSDHGIKVMRRGIDPRYASGAGAWSWSGSTEGIVNLFHRPENGGLDFSLPRVKILDAQRSVIINDLKWNALSERSVYNEPSLFVAPWCRNTIQSLANHRLVEGTEKEDEKFKDASDCLRIAYAILDKWEYKDPITMRKPGQRVTTVPVNIMNGFGDAWMN